MSIFNMNNTDGYTEDQLGELNSLVLTTLQNHDLPEAEQEAENLDVHGEWSAVVELVEQSYGSAVSQ